MATWQERQISDAKANWMQTHMDNIFAGRTFEEIAGFSYRDENWNLTDEYMNKIVDPSHAKMDHGLASSADVPTPGVTIPSKGEYVGGYTPGGRTDYPGSGVIARSLGTAYDILNEQRNYENVAGHDKGGIPDVTDIILNQAEEKYYTDYFQTYSDELKKLENEFDGRFVNSYGEETREYKHLKFKAFEAADKAVQWPFLYNEDTGQPYIDQSSQYHMDNTPGEGSARVPADASGDPGYEKIGESGQFK